MSTYTATLSSIPLELTLDLEADIHSGGSEDGREVGPIRVLSVKLDGKPITLNLIGEPLDAFLLRLCATQNPHILDANEWGED